METVPAYIACAAQILTAHELGIKIGGVSLAKKVMESKSLPPTTTIGFFLNEAQKAVEIVLQKGFGPEADRIAERIIKVDYKFYGNED